MAFVFERGTDPIGSPVSTSTLATTGLASNVAGITAVSSVLLTKVVAKNVSLPFTDQTTRLSLCFWLTKADPITVNVMSGLPATALIGEIELTEGDPGGSE